MNNIRSVVVEKICPMVLERGFYPLFLAEMVMREFFSFLLLLLVFAAFFSIFAIYL